MATPVVVTSPRVVRVPHVGRPLVVGGGVSPFALAAAKMAAQSVFDERNCGPGRPSARAMTARRSASRVSHCG